MKKTLLVTVSIFMLTGILNAQVNKGDLLLGGKFGYDASSGSSGAMETENTNVNFLPRFSVGLGKNFIVGTRLGVSYSKSYDEMYDSHSKGLQYSAGLFGRKLMPIKGNLGWFTELDGTYAKGKSETTSSIGAKQETKSQYYTIGATPGLFYFITPRLMVNIDFGGIKWENSQYTAHDGSVVKGDGVSVRIFQQFHFGFDFILNNGK